MDIIFDHISWLLNYALATYAIAISICYSLLAAISYFAIRNYKKQNSYDELLPMLQSKNMPVVSLIAPAYNEEKTIVENVRSLMNLHYPDYEVVIINDGSKDNTLQLLIEAYDLEKVDFAVNYSLKTKSIRGIYKPLNKAFKKLVVVDKINGGKADALNAGIIVSTGKLVACIDVDCILEHNSLLKLVKPFLEEEKNVIATGGVIRIANSCVIEDGKLMDIKLPKSFLARVQIIEYLRAFLMGRMAWAKIDGLLLISGAFGMFDKELLIKAGGYNHQTVGEDMELLVRMRRKMIEEKTPYKVGFIPDPLCWTEAPQSVKILMRQRNRWARGTAESLSIHREMMFNPKYGLLGMVSTPFWFFFEWMAPLVEFSGMIYFIVLLIMGAANMYFFFSFLTLVISFSILFSLVAIWFEEISFQQYKKPSAILNLVLTAIAEPLFYHPLVTWAAIKGNFDLLTGKKSWGEMTRKGFSKPNVKS